MKTLILLAGFLFVAILSAIRKMKGKRELELLESGKMCVFCRGINVTPTKAGVTCNSCGQTTLWALIQHPSLSQAEIDRVNQPDVRNPLD